MARSVVISSPPSVSSTAGPAGVSGHQQQLSGACVNSDSGAFTYRVLDAQADDAGSPSARPIATGQLKCDGRVHQQRVDLGRTEVVPLTVSGGIETGDPRGWLIITNRAVDLG